MPSTSERQRDFFNVVLAVRKGEKSRDEVGEKVLGVVDDKKMSTSEIEKMARTTDEEIEKSKRAKSLKEGMRVNPNYLELPINQEININQLLSEFQGMLSVLQMWKDQGASNVMATTSPNEWIPTWNDEDDYIVDTEDSPMESYVPSFTEYIKENAQPVNNNVKIEITKIEPDERSNMKSIERYDVNYQITIGGNLIEIDGTLEPYNTGRSTEFKFVPGHFADIETEKYHNDNWEQIESEILKHFYDTK